MNLRIELKASLSSPVALDALSRIVQAIGDGWHDWLGPDPDDGDLDAYFTQYRLHRELISKAYTRAMAYPLKSKRTVVVAEDDFAETPAALEIETTLTLRAAAIVLTQALPVLVENGINDGAFFRCLIEIVDDELAQLFAEPRPRIRFEHGGGKAEARRIVAHRAQLAQSSGVPLRLLVLVDSDAHWHGHREKETEDLRKVCAETGASLHVLKKRTIENYVTDRVLRDYADENADIALSVAFVVALPSKARDHYPIKKGVPVIKGKPNLAEGPEKQMYDGITFPAGYGPKLPHAAARFVNSGLTHTEGDLDCRACLDEVRAIAHWMREEL